MSFAELELSETLLRAVREAEYEVATPIQTAAIPPLLAGRDLVGCAQTGTGKTAAFALPTLQRLSTQGSAPRERGRKIRCLVLAPTRELASQIGESFRTYGRYTGLRHTVIFGGVGQNPQVRALQHGVDILVATPGRLLDLMNQGYVHLDRVEVLILDEADQMLDMGFIHDLRRIVARVPRERQTLLFSATMPPEIRSLADQWLHDPVAVSVTPQATPVERIAQSVHFVEQKAKPEFLIRYLKEQSAKRPLVFTRTKHGADKLVKVLLQSGIRAAAIHGNKSQNARQHALAQFKSQHPPVLVATDIAARGLDIDGVSHVVNFDLPMTPESYVHRIGRTARAGADGIAVTFCAGDERSMLREIERLTRKKLPVAGGDPGPEHHHGSRDYRPGGGTGRPERGNRYRFQKRSNSGAPPTHGGYGGKRPAKQRRFSRA
jgi:ATP-dependent RNA helicase RhlE